MSKISLWPEEITQEIGIVGPGAILKEQAAQLGQQTKNLVKAHVSSRQKETSGEPDYVDKFFVQGPVINYGYLLFSVEYPIDFYPSVITSDLSGLGKMAVSNEDQFIEALKKIFTHPKTIKIIQAVIARSKQEQPENDFDDSNPFKDE